MSDNIDPDLLAKAKKVTAHRAKTVIDHLIKHGSITTEELKNDYGYDHCIFRSIPTTHFGIIRSLISR